MNKHKWKENRVHKGVIVFKPYIYIHYTDIICAMIQTIARELKLELTIQTSYT